MPAPLSDRLLPLEVDVLRTARVDGAPGRYPRGDANAVSTHRARRSASRTTVVASHPPSLVTVHDFYFKPGVDVRRGDRLAVFALEAGGRVPQGTYTVQSVVAPSAAVYTKASAFDRQDDA